MANGDDGLLGNIRPAARGFGPLLQAAGLSLLGRGNLSQMGALLPQFEQSASQEELRDLQIKRANQQLASAERERQREQAITEALAQPGAFGAGVTPQMAAVLRADQDLAGRFLLAQATRKPQRPQVGRFVFDDFGNVLDTTAGTVTSRVPGQTPGGAIPATTGMDDEAPDLTGQQRLALSKTLTPGEKKVDERFAPDIASFDAGGGFAGVQTNLNELLDVANTIAPIDPATGKAREAVDVSGPFQGLISGTPFENLTPESKIARQRVERTIMDSLRQVLGAQFTREEGARILGLTFDPGVGTLENARRMRNLANQIRTQARQKAAAVRHFKRFGTLRGFKGQMPSFQFDPTRRRAPRTQQARRQPAGQAAAATVTAETDPPPAGTTFRSRSQTTQSLAEGQIVRNTRTGRFFQKQGSKLVPVQDPALGDFPMVGQPQLADPIGSAEEFKFLPPLGGQ